MLAKATSSSGIVGFWVMFNDPGPNMSLAGDLLRKGEGQTVLQYLELCGSFWKDARLAHWKRQIKLGQTPNFDERN